MNQWHAFKKGDGEFEKVVLCPNCSIQFPFKDQIAPINDLYGCLDLYCRNCSKEVGTWLSQEKFKKEAA